MLRELIGPIPGVRVEAVEGSSGDGASASLSDGSTLSSSKGVVVATEAPAAVRLLGRALDGSPSKTEDGVGTCCLYFRFITFLAFLSYCVLLAGCAFWQCLLREARKC